MALKITYLNPNAPEEKVMVGVRLWETADRARLVPEGHAEAAFLFCAPWQEVSKAAFELHQLDPSLGDLQPVAAAELSEAAPEAAAPPPGAELAGTPAEETVEATAPPAEEAAEEKPSRRRA